MARIIRLTESDLTRIVRRVIKEQSAMGLNMKGVDPKALLDAAKCIEKFIRESKPTFKVPQSCTAFERMSSASSFRPDAEGIKSCVNDIVTDIKYGIKNYPPKVRAAAVQLSLCLTDNTGLPTDIIKNADEIRDILKNTVGDVISFGKDMIFGDEDEDDDEFWSEKY